MKNQVSEDVKRAICNRNNYETAKKLLDSYYYDQCGHTDFYSRDNDLKRLFPIKIVYPLGIDFCYVLRWNGHKYVIVEKFKHHFLFKQYHNMNEVYDEIEKG